MAEQERPAAGADMPQAAEPGGALTAAPQPAEKAERAEKAGKTEKQNKSAERRTRPSRIGLRGRIFSYLLLFSVVMVLLLWLFQIVLLDPFFESIKTEQINESGDALTYALREGDSELLQELAEDVARNRQICISIYYVPNPDIPSLGFRELMRLDILSDCVIHIIPESEVVRLYREASVAEGQSFSARFERTAFYASPVQSSWWQRITNPKQGDIPDSLIYARVVPLEEDGALFLLLNSTIAPVGATIHALRLQLILISIILVLLALVLSNIIARRLSRPIDKINRAARRLAKGDFTGGFEGKGYREIGELAQTLNFAAAELARTDRLQQDIIANVSHDLRTPLTMIGGYAEFMRDFPQEDHSESIQVIIEETARLTALVQDVLDSSRLSSGVEELHCSLFPFSEVLAEFISRYNALIEKDGYHIELEAAEQVQLYADEQRLMQAVGNLLNNALTHCGKDKRIRVRQSVRRGRLRVEICDNGPGIAAQDLPHIWQRYYRTDAPQRSSKGSGLGLSIVKGIFELHHAAYGVESELGRGSMFWFELPLPRGKEDKGQKEDKK